MSKIEKLILGCAGLIISNVVFLNIETTDTLLGMTATAEMIFGVIFIIRYFKHKP